MRIKTRPITSFWFIAGLGLAAPLWAASRSLGADLSADNLQVQARGPVHEAFAEAVLFEPTEGIVVPRRPPDPIEEIAPDEKPEGDNLVWISGYWAWDEDLQNFLWVSGIWRDLPL